MTMTSRLAIDGGAPVRSHPYETEKGLTYLSEDEEIDAVTKVLRSRSLFRYYGPDLRCTTEAFEKRLAEIMGARYAVGVSSGTAALQCGLVGLGVEDGDEVIVPAVTFIATVGAVVWARAVPVFAEVDESLTLAPKSFEAAITDKTKAVIPVHLSNVACDMDAIMAIARRHNIAVLEDAAQAIGVSYRGRMAGSIGDAGAFSFQLSKNITTGEGGALITDDFGVFDRARRYQDQGGQFTTSHGEIREHRTRGDIASPAEPPSGEAFIGANLRMTEIAGALAGAQLTRLEPIVATMRARAQSIRQRLSDLPVDWRRIPDPDGEGGAVTMFFQDEDTAVRFSDALCAEGIPAGRVYAGRPVYSNPAILNRRTAWRTGCPFNCAEHPTERRYFMGMCPRSEDLLARSLSIGIGPRMTEEDADDVVRAVRKVAEHLL
jgi:8-amino-3,8-dideoxy-alpha-D-manno-octulosonate transaminase